MKVVDTRSSNSIIGVYKVNTLTICKEKHTGIKAPSAPSVSADEEGRTFTGTCAVVRAEHMVQITCASASVFFLICRSRAACTRGSRVSLAPQSDICLSVSHSSRCHTLYLKPEAPDKPLRPNRCSIEQGPICSVTPEYGSWRIKRFRLYDSFVELNATLSLFNSLLNDVLIRLIYFK